MTDKIKKIIFKIVRKITGNHDLIIWSNTNDPDIFYIGPAPLGMNRLSRLVAFKRTKAEYLLIMTYAKWTLPPEKIITYKEAE